MRRIVKHPELKALADQVADVPDDYLARTHSRKDPAGQARYMEAYRKAAQDDPVQQGWDKYSGEFKAKAHIFNVLSKAFESELGREAALESVRRARIKQGEEMGQRLAAKVRRQGKKLSLENFVEGFWGTHARAEAAPRTSSERAGARGQQDSESAARDTAGDDREEDTFFWSPHVDCEELYDDNGNMVKYVLRLNCPIGDYLREHSDVKVASNYCDIDEFIGKGFNPNIRYHRKHWTGGGDKYSELIWELDAQGIID